MASPRPSGLNRRAGMGMKLSNAQLGANPEKSSLGGVFGSDFQKWSQIVYVPIPPLVFLFLIFISLAPLCSSPCYCTCIACLGAGIYVSGTVTHCRDTQNSRLRFNGKAILHSEGVDFSSGQSFSLRLSDLLPQEELGKGNYGTVVHVIHRVTNAHMAMKQIKLELDNSKFMAIITELQVHVPFPRSFVISCLRHLPVISSLWPFPLLLFC